MSGNIVPWRWRKRKVPVGGQQDAVSNLQRQVNRLFNEVVSGSTILPEFVSEPLAQLGERLTSFTPNVNVRKTESSIVVSVELPGLDERDVEISLTSDGLTIRGERKLDSEDVGEDGWNYTESSYGFFERVVPLGGCRVREDMVEANSSKGIVTITIPLKTTEEGPVTRVEIKPS